MFYLTNTNSKMFFFSVYYKTNNFILKHSYHITYHPQVKSINLLNFKKFFTITLCESGSEKEVVFSDDPSSMNSGELKYNPFKQICIEILAEQIKIRNKFLKSESLSVSGRSVLNLLINSSKIPILIVALIPVVNPVLNGDCADNYLTSFLQAICQ